MRCSGTIAHDGGRKGDVLSTFMTMMSFIQHQQHKHGVVPQADIRPVLMIFMFQIRISP